MVILLLKVNLPLLHGGKPADHLVLVDVYIPLITQQSEVGQSGLMYGQMQTAFYELQTAETHSALVLLMGIVL